MNEKSPMAPIIKYMSFVLMPLTSIAVAAFAVAGGGLVFTAFGGDGLGVTAVSGGICAVSFGTMLLAARFGFLRSRRQGVAAGRVAPIRFF
jgi:hypothetical protein